MGKKILIEKNDGWVTTRNGFARITLKDDEGRHLVSFHVKDTEESILVNIPKNMVEVLTDTSRAGEKMSERSIKVIKIEGLTCDDCGGNADFVVIEKVGKLKGYRILCEDCIKDYPEAQAMGDLLE